MNNFVEVYGESSYEESPKKVIIDVDLSVRAAKEDIATTGIQNLTNDLIDQLINNGIDKNDLYFGGRETFLPWWKRKKAGVEIRNRITIKSEDRPNTYQALENIERYKDDKRIIVSINERQPLFEAEKADIENALKKACADAKRKAQILADACGKKVGNVLEIQETKRGVRGSGSYGDYDWGDYNEITLAAAAAASSDDLEEPAARIEGNKRTVFLKYRIKYELI